MEISCLVRSVQVDNPQAPHWRPLVDPSTPFIARFNELTARGEPFAFAVRRAIAAALAERDAEGGGTDPRLRFITECSIGSDEVLFTPVTWDLGTALRQNEDGLSFAILTVFRGHRACWI
eukprot:s6307_g3.t1